MICFRRTLVAFLAVTFLSAGATLAQTQRPYRGTVRSVRQLIMRIENRTDVFRNSLNAQNLSGVYGPNGENIDSLVSDLDRAVEQLQVRFNQGTTTSADAQEVLNRAALIQPLIGRDIRGANVIRNWNLLRADLNQAGECVLFVLAQDRPKLSGPGDAALQR